MDLINVIVTCDMEHVAGTASYHVKCKDCGFEKEPVEGSQSWITTKQALSNVMVGRGDYRLHFFGTS